MPIMD